MADTPSTLLTMLKVDLGITTTAYDSRLTQIIASASSAIMAEGVGTLDVSDPLDAQLVVMYAAWLWRRRDTMEGMPRMIRWALNNRVFGETMQAGGGGNG